jgi:hypothetical protein
MCTQSASSSSSSREESVRARAFVIVIPRATSIERVDIKFGVRKNLERNEKNLRHEFCSLFDESDDESDIYISAVVVSSHRVRITLHIQNGKKV